MAFGEVEVGELLANTSRAMCPLLGHGLGNARTAVPRRCWKARPTYSQRLAMPLALCEATGG